MDEQRNLSFNPKTELAFLEDRIKKLEKGILQIDLADLPSAKELVSSLERARERDMKNLEELRVRAIRIRAEIEEAMRGGA